jgi:hypothetical protein
VVTVGETLGTGTTGYRQHVFAGVSCKAGELEDEIHILERLLEEIRMASEVPEDRINEREFKRRLMNIIRMPRNK